MSISIVVLQRGWVVVGVDAPGGISAGAVIRRWGTERGLGQLAVAGPLRETVLDLLPTGAQWHPLTEVLRIPCREEAWETQAREWDAAAGGEVEHG